MGARSEICRGGSRGMCSILTVSRRPCGPTQAIMYFRQGGLIGHPEDYVDEKKDPKPRRITNGNNKNKRCRSSHQSFGKAMDFASKRIAAINRKVKKHRAQLYIEEYGNIISSKAKNKKQYKAEQKAKLEKLEKFT